MKHNKVAIRLVIIMSIGLLAFLGSQHQFMMRLQTAEEGNPADELFSSSVAIGVSVSDLVGLSGSEVGWNRSVTERFGQSAEPASKLVLNSSTVAGDGVPAVASKVSEPRIAGALSVQAMKTKMLTPPPTPTPPTPAPPNVSTAGTAPGLSIPPAVLTSEYEHGKDDNASLVLTENDFEYNVSSSVYLRLTNQIQQLKAHGRPLLIKINTHPCAGKSFFIAQHKNATQRRGSYMGCKLLDHDSYLGPERSSTLLTRFKTNAALLGAGGASESSGRRSYRKAAILPRSKDVVFVHVIPRTAQTMSNLQGRQRGSGSKSTGAYSRKEPVLKARAEALLLVFNDGIQVEPMFHGFDEALQFCIDANSAAPPTPDQCGPTNSSNEGSRLKHFRDKFSSGGMNRPEQELLVSTYSDGDSVFEWGMGSSTLIAAHADIKRLTGVNSDPRWVKRVRSTLKQIRPAYMFVHADIGPVKWHGRPRDPSFSLGKASKYSLEVDRESEPYDVYLVDGRFRVACACRAFLQGRADSLVLVHDFERSDYQVLLQLADIVRQCHSLAVLRRKATTADDELLAVWKDYRHIPS